jgi:hypothetical protein
MDMRLRGIDNLAAGFFRGTQLSRAGNPLSDVIKSKQALHTADLALTQAYIKRDPPAVAKLEQLERKGHSS